MRNFPIIYLFAVIILFVLGCESSNNSSGPNEVRGCMDNTACNFKLNATVNDGSCAYENDICGGEITNESDCPDMPGGTVEINYNSDTPDFSLQLKV